MSRMDSLGTELIDAVRNNSSKKVIKLIQDGADVNYVDPVWGSTPLFIAIRYKLYDVAEMLINNGADVNIKPEQNEDGVPPLINAIDMGSFEIVRLLVIHGANMNYVQPNGITPFTYSLYLDATEIAKLFIKHGADVDRANFERVTPLMIVCGNGNEELIDLLIRKGANVDAKNMDGKTAFDLLREKNKALYNRLNSKYNFLRANDRLWDLTQGHIEAKTQKTMAEYMGNLKGGRRTKRRKSAKRRKTRSQRKH